MNGTNKPTAIDELHKPLSVDYAEGKDGFETSTLWMLVTLKDATLELNERLDKLERKFATAEETAETASMFVDIMQRLTSIEARISESK